MTIDDATNLKIVQLMIMDEIHKLCLKNNIIYYIVGGTLLGAIRHKGFIPWDIDVDIAMQRDEYDKFKSVCKYQLSNKFQYYDYACVDNYDKPHAIVCAKGTKLFSSMDYLTPERPNLGIFVDVFPLDKIPLSKNEKIIQKRRINYYKTLRYLRIPYYTSPSALKRLGRRIIKTMLSVISVNSLNEKMDRCMRLYNNMESCELCNMAGRYSVDKETLPYEVFGIPNLVKFEGREYYAPENYDKYLKHIYGDYMKLPPLEEQMGYLNTYDTIEFGEFLGEA